MSKIPLMLLIVHILNTRADASNRLQTAVNVENSAKDHQSAEQLREFDLEELIKSLEARINTKEVTSQESKRENNQRDSRGTGKQRQSSYCDKSSIFQGQTISAKANPTPNPNPRDRKSIGAKRSGRDEDLQAEISAILDDLEARGRNNERKNYETKDDIDELIKEAYGLTHERTSSSDGSLHRNQLDDYDKDDQYRRSLLRLLSLYRLHNKRYLEDELQGEDRLMQLSSNFGKKLDRVDSGKLNHLDKSRLLADRIAESALLLGYNKGRILDHVLRPGQSGKLSLEETAKRDVEVSSSTSAASSTSVDASVATSGAVAGGAVTGGAVAGGAVTGAVSTAGAVNVGASTNVDTALGVSGGLRVDGGTSVSAGLGTRTSSGLSLLGQLGSCQDFERRMIMDMAIEEASAMIRKLAYETRSEIGCKSDPDFERRILSLAIDLVNKVTLGTTTDLGSKFDLMSGYRYNGVDDYLKSSVFDAELQADLVANSGFDYAGHRDLLDGRRIYDNLDLYDDYMGLGPYSRGRCDSCSKYDLRMGNMCPVCKRSGNTMPNRMKRKSSRCTDERGQICRFEELRND